MKLTSESFEHEGTIPTRFAFCRPDPASHVTFSDNESPHLAWSEVPEGTRSFALYCIDADAPTVGDDVNQDGRTVPHDLARADFVHWLMIDIPATTRELPAGACGQGVVPRGKEVPPGPEGSKQGQNDYTGWFAGDADMAGTYLGYDGPCPPWNDERMHEYNFCVFALDVEELDLTPGFTVKELNAALAGHVLAQAERVGCYTLNPDLM